MAFLKQYADALEESRRIKAWGPNAQLIRTILAKITNSNNKVVREALNKDEEYRTFVADFESRFTVADQNFPRIDEEASDLEDSVIVNKHPFAIRRSDFEGLDRVKFDSVSRYVLDDDDSDKDESDDDSDVTPDSEPENDEEEDVNRQRIKTGAVQPRLSEVGDLEGEIEVDELTSNDIGVSVVISTAKDAIGSIDEFDGPEKVHNELMSPVNSKQEVDEDAGSG